MLELVAEETEQDHKMGSGPVHPSLPFPRPQSPTNKVPSTIRKKKTTRSRENTDPGRHDMQLSFEQKFIEPGPVWNTVLNMAWSLLSLPRAPNLAGEQTLTQNNNPSEKSDEQREW